jgi:hypothetical protein
MYTVQTLISIQVKYLLPTFLKQAYATSSLRMCLGIPCICFSMPEPICMQLDTLVIATEAISTIYFMIPFHQPSCVSVLSLGGSGLI